MIAPPPNPAVEQARASIAAYQATLRAERKPAQPLHPIDVALPVWLMECNDCGVPVMIDDPALCFSGMETTR